MFLSGAEGEAEKDNQNASWSKAEDNGDTMGLEVICKELEVEALSLLHLLLQSSLLPASLTSLGWAKRQGDLLP